MNDLESLEHPDIECVYCGNGAMLRWCDECEGYHHLHPQLWKENHERRIIIDPDSGEMIVKRKLQEKVNS